MSFFPSYLCESLVYPLSFITSKLFFFVGSPGPPLLPLSVSTLLLPACCTFEQNITVTLESHNGARAAVICSKRRPSSTWGFRASQVPHVSLRDLVARAAVSDHFQLDLHFALRVPCWGGRGGCHRITQVSSKASE